MICTNCNYLFDAKQHAVDGVSHALLNRPSGIPNGWEVAVVCPRCVRRMLVKREYGVFPVAKEALELEKLMMEEE